MGRPYRGQGSHDTCHVLQLLKSYCSVPVTPSALNIAGNLAACSCRLAISRRLSAPSSSSAATACSMMTQSAGVGRFSSTHSNCLHAYTQLTTGWIVHTRGAFVQRVSAAMHEGDTSKEINAGLRQHAFIVRCTDSVSLTRRLHIWSKHDQGESGMSAQSC